MMFRRIASVAPPLLAVIVWSGCGSADAGSDRIRLGGSQAFYAADGTVAALGSRSRYENEAFSEAERRGAPLPRWREFLRIGSWEYRYPNDQTKAVISYEIGWYTDCCTGGLCKQPYEFRSGEFRAWWQDGSPLAQGTFALERQHVETNCEGGDWVKRAVIEPGAMFWDRDGAPADRSVLLIANLDLETM